MGVAREGDADGVIHGLEDAGDWCRLGLEGCGGEEGAEDGER